MWDYLRLTSTCPHWMGDSQFLVIPPGPNVDINNLPNKGVTFFNWSFFLYIFFIFFNSDRFRLDFYLKRRAVGAGDPGCGHSRKTCVREPIIYDSFWQEQKVIHFISKPEENWRLLQHFYTFIHFDDPNMDLLFKRFVRDYIHYIDIIFCKAAIIVSHLLHEGNGSYTSFHIRR